MKKSVTVLAILLSISFIAIPGRTAHSQTSRQLAHPYADDAIIVKLKDNIEPIDDAEIPEFVLKARGATLERLAPKARGGINLIHLNGRVSVEQAIGQAQADPRVEYAEPDYILHTTDVTPNDPLFFQMWGLSNPFQGLDGGVSPADIGATHAWDLSTGSDDLVVAVTDTGIQVGHPDLAANIWRNPGEIPGNGVDDDGNGFVDDVNGWNFFNKNNSVYVSPSEDFHGTHVAGTIGAVGNNGIGTAGVAWHVKLMSLKFLGGPKGTGKSSDAIKAINYVIDEKNRGVNVRVINASWGGGDDSQGLRDALAEAGNAGILFVCAAGNEALDNDDEPSYPTAYAKSMSNVISVAAITQADQLASFSNYGHSTVSVAAPGSFIYSTVPDGTYGQLSGTSQATPHVTGIAALLFASNPALSPAQVKDRIIRTAEPITALASKTVASGRANAYFALTNRIAPATRPVITNANVSKKNVTIEGLGFLPGSSIVEVEGVTLAGEVVYDNSYVLSNNTTTHLTVQAGKKPIKKAFPSGVLVSVTVFNPTTGERSARMLTGRF
jgi:subtilisin family serine protease